MRALPNLSGLLLLCLPAQSQRVTPVGLATTQGNAQLNQPFGNYTTARFQQIVTDLGAAMNVTQIAFRQGASNAAWSGRTVTLDLHLGLSSYANRSIFFASNFIGTPVLAISSKALSLPSFVNPPAAGYPAPFDCKLPLDAPWAYPGNNDCAFQITLKVNSQSANGYGLNGNSYSDTNTGTFSTNGVGCIATGQAATMYCNPSFTTQYGSPLLKMSWAGYFAPPGAPIGVLLATAGASVPIFGLCTNVYVFNVFLTLNTTSQPSSSFQTTSLDIPFSSSYVGLTLFSQAAAPDPGQSLIAISASQGAAGKVPSIPPKPFDICYLFAASSTATSASIVNNWGLATQWK